MATKLEGGGKALVARPLEDELFFAASLRGALNNNNKCILYYFYVHIVLTYEK